jgi:hypothetical protein
MTKHDPDDIYWNRYRERSLAEMEHFMRKRRRAPNENQASDKSGLPDLGSTLPDTTEGE